MVVTTPSTIMIHQQLTTAKTKSAFLSILNLTVTLNLDFWPKNLMRLSLPQNPLVVNV